MYGTAIVGMVAPYPCCIRRTIVTGDDATLSHPIVPSGLRGTIVRHRRDVFGSSIDPHAWRFSSAYTIASVTCHNSEPVPVNVKRMRAFGPSSAATSLIVHGCR